MINWTLLKSRQDLTQDIIDEIRIALLVWAKNKNPRIYALFLAVICLGVNHLYMQTLKVQFLPSVDGGIDWVILYEGKALNMTSDAHDAFNNYIHSEARFEPYLLGKRPMGGVEPLFVSDCNRTKNAPMRCARWLFKDGLEAIGYYGKWLHLDWITMPQQA